MAGTASPEVEDQAPAPEPKKKHWGRRILLTVLGIVVVLLALVIGVLLYFNIPANGAGMAAQAVCSASYMGGRAADSDSQLMADDVIPASPAFGLISVNRDDSTKSVTAKFLGLFPRVSSLTTDRGCVLDLPPDPGAVPYDPASESTAAWPTGNTALDPAAWPAAVDSAALQAVVDKGFEGAGDPKLANTRGIAVVYDGQLLVSQEAPGFEPNTALHGWSMTKTIAAMLAYKKFTEVGLDIQTPVVDAFPDGRAPEWVEQWRQDERAQITVADLMYMRDGLKMSEGYDATSQVVQMLNSEPNMAAWAASHPAEYPAGTRWQYLSATSNILAAVVRGQFASDEEYWTYPSTALADPIGATSASLATDASGTWVGSSYEWASVGDWARFGEVMLNDGDWQGTQVLPSGWVDVATTQALPDGEGAGYGAQTWLWGNPVGGECRDYPGVPEDTMGMGGHWGQMVAMVPSRDAVIVRLGWTFDSDQFDSCQMISDVVATLPAR